MLVSVFLLPDKLIAQYKELQNELEQEVNNQNFIRAQILLDSLTLTELPADLPNYYNGVINICQ